MKSQHIVYPIIKLDKTRISEIGPQVNATNFGIKCVLNANMMHPGE